jgi:hypothetical protein
MAGKTDGKYKITLPKFFCNQEGFVYCVRVLDFIKIGRTNNPSNRLSQYENYPPFNSEIIFCEKVYDYKFYERVLQIYLLEFQHKGEWFEIPEFWLSNVNKNVIDMFNGIDKQIKEYIDEERNKRL